MSYPQMPHGGAQPGRQPYPQQPGANGQFAFQPGYAPPPQGQQMYERPPRPSGATAVLAAVAALVAGLFLVASAAGGVFMWRHDYSSFLYWRTPPWSALQAGWLAAAAMIALGLGLGALLLLARKSAGRVILPLAAVAVVLVSPVPWLQRGELTGWDKPEPLLVTAGCGLAALIAVIGAVCALASPTARWLATR